MKWGPPPLEDASVRGGGHEGKVGKEEEEK